MTCIGIDYTAAVCQRAGIGRYTRNLVQALSTLESTLDAETCYTLFVACRGDRQQDTWPVNFRVRRVPISDRWLHIIWQRLRVPIPVQLATGRVDLFHSPDFVLPPLGRTPGILTVHDLSFLRVPDCFVQGFRVYLEKAVVRSIRRAVHILADSDSTRRDLIELLAVSPDRVSVLYPGVETRFHPIRDESLLGQVRARYSLPPQFILGLGTLQPRKNFARLVEAFGSALAHSHPALDEVALVIGGGKGWMAEDISAVARRIGLGNRVQLLGFVDDDDLPALYSMAAAFAFPSLYEGFGLPVLEAMACGTPVVTADNSSLPEVAGQAALLVPATDIAALAEALFLLLTEDELSRALTVRGLEQANRFRWEKSAAQLQSVYRAALMD